MAHLHLEGVGVDIPVAYLRSRRRRLFGPRAGLGRPAGDAADRQVVSAIRDVSLDLGPGARVGLVGRNGAGKSTLLRVLAGIYRPTAGRIAREGEVVALFNTGLGMSEFATGYENIVTLGLVFGMSRDEIENRMAEIAEFTEIGEALNRPVRTYSSGMRMRLSFAVATATEPEILLIDEVVGAGDQGFREKAQKRFAAMAERASILAVATHSNDLIRRLCTRVIRLEQGRVEADGPVDEIL